MNDIFERGVEDVIVRAELEKTLKTDRKLRLKFGVDPTSPDIHLGHAVALRILRKFQDAGHTVIFLIGDATTRIGDPSGRNSTRPILTDTEIKANVTTYLDQVGQILDLDKCEIRHNSEWLDKIDFVELLRLAGQFTVAQMIERDDFRKRLEAGHELGLHELLYPVMQAYDSVALEADVEFGGTDQRFNLLAGRDLQKKMGQSPQQVFMVKLLLGTDGVQKMSKSLGNYIGITDEPVDMYGKVMSIPDQLIREYYELCTDIDMTAIDALVKTLAAGANPRDAKASLAREIVRIYHGEAAALKAEDGWNQTFRDKDGPTEDQITYVGKHKASLVDFLLAADILKSRSEVRRLVEQNGIRVNDKLATSVEADVNPDDMVQIGKKRFYKLADK